MGVLGILALLWRWRFTLLIILGLGLAGGVYLRLWSLKLERDAAEADLKDAVTANAVTVATLNSLKAEKDRNEALLASRASRKSKEADQLGKLVKHLLEAKDEGSCPSMPIIDNAIDGLR